MALQVLLVLTVQQVLLVSMEALERLALTEVQEQLV
jgi:hypothetical protein